MDSQQKSVLDTFSSSQIVGEALKALSRVIYEEIVKFRDKLQAKGKISKDKPIYKEFDLYTVI